MVDFDRIRLTAQRLIEANGRSVVLAGDPSGDSDPSRPWRGPDFSGGPTETVIVAFVPASGTELGRALRQLLGGESLVRGFDQVGLLAAASLSSDIATYDRVIDGSAVWKLESVDTLQPGPLPILYQLGLNR